MIRHLLSLIGRGLSGFDRHATVLLALPLAGLLAHPAAAQTYTYVPVTVSGFTADVVANKTGSASTSTTKSFDISSNALMVKGYDNGAGSTATVGLPVTGAVASATTSGLKFQLADYDSNNSLRFVGSGSGVLTLANPLVANTVYLLAAAAGGNTLMTAVITFTDNTTQTFSSLSVPDWFNGSPVTVKGLGSVSVSMSNIDNDTDNPRLYELTLSLSAGNTEKLVQSITVTNRTSGTQVLNVMGVTLRTNSPNNALAFDGANSYVHSTGTLPSTNEFTLEGWINRTSFSGNLTSFLMADDFPAGAMHCQFDNSNRLNIGINGTSPGGISTTTALPAGQWTHVAAVYSASAKSYSIYINGVLNNTVALATTVPIAALPYSLGGWLSGGGLNRPFTGKFDEVRIYNAALTQAQIQADMYSTTSALPANQVAYYNFDQGTASGTNTGITTLNDQSGNNNTGTLNGFALTGATSNWVHSFPTITSISPTSGQISSSVTVAGTNLTDATSFKFNGTVVAPFTTPTSDFSATVTVPNGATTGPVSVSSATLSLYNGPAFTVITTAVTWTGAVNTDWATAGNWSPAVVPTPAIDVTIPAAANQPVMNGTQKARSVTVGANAHLSLAGGNTPGLLTLGTINATGSLTLAAGSTFTQGAASEIYITGNMTNNGATFDPNATSKVGFSFTTKANHLLNGTAGVTFQTLTVGEQSLFDNLTMQVPVQVLRKLGVYHTSTTSLGTGGSLTLVSNASGTALVENGDLGSSVNGNVNVQRYIDPTLNLGLGYRHYSAPVSNAMVSTLTTSGYKPVVNTTYNTSSNPGSVVPFPTSFEYDETNVKASGNPGSQDFGAGFRSSPSLNDGLAPGQGYAENIAASETVVFNGPLNNGIIPMTGLTRGSQTNSGWWLLGNPYPAPLDYSLVAAGDRPNLDGAIYVYSSTSQYKGTYRSYVNGMGGNSVLPVAQGFFVRVSTGLPQPIGALTFRNSQRLTAPEVKNTTFQRGTADTRPMVQLELHGTTNSADAFYAYAQAGATPAFDSQFDAEKLANPTGLNLSSRTISGQRLAIDGRPAFDATTVLPLAVGVPAAGTYTLAAVALANLPAGLGAYLSDAQTGQTVNLRTQPRYAFNVTAAQATALLVGRFSLRFTASVLATAPALTAAQVELYPNPAHARFAVLMPGVPGAAAVQAELVNALGQVVRRQSAALPASGATLTVETAELAAGVYTLRLLAGPTTLAKRVVIQ